ncbi:MAG: response regulator, partial [Defluviitaleaceae bacterium]|nr:response regulator [Defluviitaleaceae bacterium]
MLKVFICEDNARQLLSLTNLVDFCIKSNAYNASIAMSTQFPDEIIAVMPQQNTTGLYFLDIDLGCDIDAYKLSAIIREHDSRAFIVIVTSDENAHATVLKHTVEPMDYIVKNSPDYEARIKTCIKVAYKRHIANSTVTGVE